MKTELKRYTLWYDGTLDCQAKDIESFISKVPVGKLAVEKLNTNIRRYNSLVSKSEAIVVKTDCNPLDFGWDIPDEYMQLDLKMYLLDKVLDYEFPDDGPAVMKRTVRTLHELRVFISAGLENMLRCLIHIVDVFKKRKVVWGVGRGSSVSSYILYLIGIHDIDCVEYDLPFTDFMKA